jgi:hypothetical protein
MTTDFARAKELLEQTFDRHRHRPQIDPAFLASEALTAMSNAAAVLNMAPDIYRLAHAHMKQMARALCRGRFEGADESQPELFEGLQVRYPKAHQTAERVYVLLEHMDEADVAFNVARLRKESQAKADHADALEDWWRQRIANQKLQARG